MADFKPLLIPSEDYDALGITPGSVLETRVTDDGILIVRVVNAEDLDDLICGSDCECCPMTFSNKDGGVP
jgi:bifunctional DNA-binding transcriptional regulator/antitoxin component of YhaV-PrlF toxin-antitoxin module